MYKMLKYHVVKNSLKEDIFNEYNLLGYNDM
jgi:hypothetical protein